MTRAPVHLIVVLGVIAVAGLVGWFQFVMPRQFELGTLETNIETYRQRAAQAERTLGVVARTDGIGPVRLHNSGDEPVVVRSIYRLAEAVNLSIASFSLLETFDLPIEQVDNNAAASPISTGTQQLPEFDANGVAIGVPTDTGSDLATALRVMPVQLAVRGTFAAWGRFLSGLNKELPSFRIRKLVYRSSDGDLVSGQIQLAIPVSAEGADASSGHGSH